MTSGAMTASSAKRSDQGDRRIDLFRRFLQAGIADQSLLPRVDDDAVLFLLPDDDPTLLEQEIAAATESAKRGHNVYLHHVRVADLPELPEAAGRWLEQPGTQRATFDPETGTLLTNRILGADGEWRDSDLPLPTSRDNESDPDFRG